jgi:perosamine synthetase
MILRRRIDAEEGELQEIIAFLSSKKSKRDYVSLFERQFAEYIGVCHAIAVSSGRYALELILRALELGRGAEVIIPAYTLQELVPVIQGLGLKAVAADIDPRTFNLSPGSVSGKITPRTKVILATHIFGNPCEIEKIGRLAKKRGIYVIEDCAHSAGSGLYGRKLGSFGRAGFFSLESMKLINTYGGGVITTDDSRLARKIRIVAASYESRDTSILKKLLVARLEKALLPTFLSYPLLYALSSPLKKRFVGMYRGLQGHPSPTRGFSNLQAFLGLKRLKTIEKRIRERNHNARLFCSLLNKNIRPQKIIGKTNYYFFVALLNKPAAGIRRILLRNGFDAGIEDEITDNCAAYLGQKDCREAESVFRRAIHLPIHEGISEKDIRRLAEMLNKRCR